MRLRKLRLRRRIACVCKKVKLGGGEVLMKKLGYRHVRPSDYDQEPEFDVSDQVTNGAGHGPSPALAARAEATEEKYETQGMK